MTTGTKVSGLRLLRVKEVEKMTGLEAWRLYELIAAGEGPPHMKVGRTIRIPEAGLVQWIEERTEKEAAR